MKSPQRLLVASVGGSAEPLVTSILHWLPLKAIFVVSRDSRNTVPAVENGVQSHGYLDFRGRWESFVIDDPQDIRKTCQQLQRLFQERVAPQSAEGWETVVDFTGGTKVMSAAMATTAASFGKCHLSYVGGRDRSEAGLGEVVSGAEEIIQSYDPWEASGLRAVDEADALLRNHAFTSAATVLKRTLPFLSDPEQKDKLNAAATLADALSDWDRFRFGDAVERCKQVKRKQPLLESTFGSLRTAEIMRQVEVLLAHCSSLLAEPIDGVPRLTRDLILDLLANAQRRYDEGRWDDATARLYRAIEAIAQLRLDERGLKTSAIPVESLPPALKAKCAPSADHGLVKLGLQDAWELLGQLADPIAPVFRQRFGDPMKSPLTARNESILAHGFSPVSQATAKQLLQIGSQLLEVVDIDPIFQWPRIAETS